MRNERMSKTRLLFFVSGAVASFLEGRLSSAFSFSPQGQRRACFRPRVLASQQRRVLHLSSSKSDHQLIVSASSTTTTSSAPTTLKDDEKTRENVKYEETARDEALRLKAQAEQMRLEAERMDLSLTLEKIATLEEKLVNKKWLKQHGDDGKGAALLKDQLEALQRKLENISSSSRSSSLQPHGVRSQREHNDYSLQDDSEGRARPLCGFSKSDLDLYLPVAMEIEARMNNTTTNSTIEDKLAAFRRAPELQEHFQNRIRTMLVEPLQDLQRISNLKESYLASSSRVEKDQIKREMQQLEKALSDKEEKDPKFGPPEVASSLYRMIDPMSEEEMENRLQAVKRLPAVLQILYKRRCGVLEESDSDNGNNESLRLAIDLEHYEKQLELLEQVRFLVPLDDKQRAQAIKAVESLPVLVREHFAKYAGLEKSHDANALISELEAGADDPAWSSLKLIMDSSGHKTNSMPTEYDDIDFLDRSRYMEEFHPSVTRLEESLPDQADVDIFVSKVLSNKAFMMSCKPERVMGGYYIRGENVLKDDDASGKKLVEQIQQKLEASPVKDRIDFFHIPDPSGLSDEEVEEGYEDQSLILLTAKNTTELFKCASPLTKIGVSGLGFLSIALFAVGTCALEPHAQDRIDAALAAGNSEGLAWLINDAAMVAGSMIGIQIFHEIAHQFFAWKDKFEIGLPTPVASIQMGLLGAITPLKSPTPSLRSLFDFSISGPLLGLIVSITCLTVGLSLTSSIDINQASDLPALPMYLLRSSTLGGGLIEMFLGKGALMRELPGEAILPLHPFAISGFVGILSNALALLPLGHTDGGRISVALFGRRGAFIVKFFTAILLVVVGILGFDESSILLTYTLYTFIWQRELEAPARNEVEQLDFARASLAIATAVLVTLALVPLQ